MVCRRMLCGTGVFSGDAGTRWQIAAYHGATQAVSSTRSGLPRQNCAVRNGLFLSVGQQGHHVQPNGGCDIQDWKRLAGSNQRGTLAPSCENTWTQTQFKLDTLVDWQLVKEITHRRGNGIVFAPADYQSSCGVKDSLQLRRWMSCTPAKTALQ